MKYEFSNLAFVQDTLEFFGSLSKGASNYKSATF